MAETNTDANVELLKAKLEAQKKDKMLHLIVGLFVGLLVGFFGANWMNAHPGVSAPAGTQVAADSSGMPADHPPAAGGGGGAGPQAAMPEVQAKLKAADDNPQDYDAQMQAAEMFHRINNPEKMLYYLQRAYALEPNDYDTLLILANETFDAGKYEDAKPLYTKAVELKPDNLDVRTDLGTTYWKLNDLDKAIDIFQTVLRTNPKHEFALRNLAVVSIQKGDAATAEDAVNRLASVSPQNEALATLRQDLTQLKTKGKIPTH
jgi:tetratricopeptide (TPR) repeat protein